MYSMYMHMLHQNCWFSLKGDGDIREFWIILECWQIWMVLHSSLCECVCVCVHVCIRTHVCTYMYMQVCKHVHVCVFMCELVCMCVHARMCACVRVYVCMCVYISVCALPYIRFPFNPSNGPYFWQFLPSFPINLFFPLPSCFILSFQYPFIHP